MHRKGKEVQNHFPAIRSYKIQQQAGVFVYQNKYIRSDGKSQQIILLFFHYHYDIQTQIYYYHFNRSGNLYANNNFSNKARDNKGSTKNRYDGNL